MPSLLQIMIIPIATVSSFKIEGVPRDLSTNMTEHKDETLHNCYFGFPDETLPRRRAAPLQRQINIDLRERGLAEKPAISDYDETSSSSDDDDFPNLSVQSGKSRKLRSDSRREEEIKGRRSKKSKAKPGESSGKTGNGKSDKPAKKKTVPKGGRKRKRPKPICMPRRRRSKSNNSDDSGPPSDDDYNPDDNDDNSSTASKKKRPRK